MNVALIELSSSHDECLYTQIKLLKSRDHVHVTLIVNECLAMPITYYDLDIKVHMVKSRKGFKGLVDSFKLRQFLLSEKFDTIIFNTASGKAIRNLLIMMPQKGIKYIGTVHNTLKLKKSTTQKYISKYVKKYFVLNDYLTAEADYSNLTIGTYYPIDFPAYPIDSLLKNENEIWICIPGQVESKRRDYHTLLDQIEQYGLGNHIKLILLGKSNHTAEGNSISDRIKKIGISNQVNMWDGFVDTKTFYQYITASDYILPLIHWDHVSGKLYKHQITGAFNLAYGFQIPLLMEKEFCHQVKYIDPCLQYPHEDLLSFINILAKPYSKKRLPIKLSLEYQTKQYWNLIDS